MKDCLTNSSGVVLRPEIPCPELKMLHPHEELELCRRRRILAWEELEEYEGGGPVKSAGGPDLTSILIERAKADVEPIS